MTSLDSVSIHCEKVGEYSEASVATRILFDAPLDAPLGFVGLDLQGNARSYSQAKAIAYALEDLALKILKEAGR